MWTFWLAFFIVGCCIGRALNTWPMLAVLYQRPGEWGQTLFAGSIGLGLLVLSRPCLSTGPHPRIWVVPLAILWGMAHSAPVAPQSKRSAVIVKAGGSLGSSGPLLIVADDQIFEAYGKAGDAPLGRLSGKNSLEGKLFARHDSYFKPSIEGHVPRGPVSRWVVDAQSWFAQQFAQHPDLRQGWLSSILLGDKSALNPDLRQAFKQAGVYHLLIVSGLHVTLMVFCLSLFIQIPLQLAYALRLIPPFVWPSVQALVQVVVAALGATYLLLAGAPVAAQRATLMFLLWQLARVFTGLPPLTRRMVFAGTMQSWLFPVGFVGEASLMTWAAYLLVIQSSRRRSKAFVAGLGQTLFLQSKMILLTAGAFGQVSFIGVAANLLLVPLLGLLLATGVLLVFWPGVPAAGAFKFFHNSFIETIEISDALSRTWKWLALTPEMLPEWVRPVSLITTAVLLLNACRDLSISQED